MSSKNTKDAKLSDNNDDLRAQLAAMQAKLADSDSRLADSTGKVTDMEAPSNHQQLSASQPIGGGVGQFGVGVGEPRLHCCQLGSEAISFAELAASLVFFVRHIVQTAVILYPLAKLE